MDNKKTYTPEEVAAAVLKKAHELWKESNLAKAANTSHEVEPGEEPNNDDAEAPEYLADADIEDDYKEDEKRKGKKSSGEAGEAEAEEGGEDKHADEPEHEKDMSAEEEKEHDAAENEADEKDADKIEADEEDGGVSDEDDAESPDTDKVIEEAADDSDDKDKKKKKEVEKSEAEATDLKKSVGKLKKFMARRAIRKSRYGPGVTSLGSDSKRKERHKRLEEKISKDPKESYLKDRLGIKDKSKQKKNAKIEKMLGMKGCK